ncbi:DUF4097 family beta strand repeat-containing protein [Oceanobacillus manasiensis]|uniref:DUF4097 family beta strand repeat-containing protein n=1 Tax=Oceanobacillus manasiensis TaxID=586413 RepID=UPI0005AA02A5|nr:DUF4097 family beta strand repeat-containing protein [Oceanobacillus manasiensis]
MRNLKKLSILAIILLVVGVTGGVITFASSDRSDIFESEVFPEDGVEKVDIQLNNQKMNIKPSQSSEVIVELEGKGNRPDKNRLHAEMQGDKLIIETKAHDEKLFRFFDWGDRLTLTVYLPDKEFASIQLDVDNGSINAEQINSTDIVAETNNGKIMMENILSERVNVESNNGKITLHNVEGELNGKTNNGAISLVTESLDRSIQLGSDNGKIKIETNEEPTNVTFDVRVDNGKIDIFGNSDWDTVVGDGENRVKLTTHNGSITVSH